MRRTTTFDAKSNFRYESSLPARGPDHSRSVRKFTNDTKRKKSLDTSQVTVGLLVVCQLRVSRTCNFTVRLSLTLLKLRRLFGPLFPNRGPNFLLSVVISLVACENCAER